jgi:hypothetical protein
VKATWALRIDRAALPALGACRLVPGVEVAEVEGGLWLRGVDLPDADRLKFLALPDAVRFDIGPDGALRPEGNLLSAGTLPAAKWIALRDAVPVELPVSAFSGTRLRPATLRCERSDVEATPNAALLSWADWSRYAVAAPRVRLERWRFARDGGDRVLVCGTPLPPLPSAPYVEQDGIALPAGWRLIPRLPSAAVARLLDLAPGDVALFAPDGAWERLRGEDFAAASRAAIRLSGDPAVGREEGR